MNVNAPDAEPARVQNDQSKTGEQRSGQICDSAVTKSSMLRNEKYRRRFRVRLIGSASIKRVRRASTKFAAAKTSKTKSKKTVSTNGTEKRSRTTDNPAKRVPFPRNGPTEKTGPLLRLACRRCCTRTTTEKRCTGLNGCCDRNDGHAC